MGVLIAVAAVTCLIGCDVDLFRLDWKRLGGGYSLVLAEQNNACAIIAPHESGGPTVTEIGWRKPLILSRSEDSCDVLDTTTGKHVAISEQQRQSDLAYREIPIYPARNSLGETEAI